MGVNEALEAIVEEVSELNQEGISISMDSSIPNRYEKSIELFEIAERRSSFRLPSWELYSFTNAAYSKRQLGNDPMQIAESLEFKMLPLLSNRNRPDEFSLGRAFEEMAVARRSAEPNILAYTQGIDNIETAISHYDNALSLGGQIVPTRRVADQRLRAYGLAAMLNLVTGKMVEGEEREDYFHNALDFAHKELDGRKEGPNNYNFMNAHHIVGVIHSEMMLTGDEDKDYDYTMASNMLGRAQDMNNSFSEPNKNVAAVLDFRLAKLNFDYNPENISGYVNHLNSFLSRVDGANPIVINGFKEDLLKMNEVVQDTRITELYQ